ncbi:MAG: phosphodiester glycosidase family protein [Sporichthyaceae bacterium]
MRSHPRSVAMALFAVSLAATGLSTTPAARGAAPEPSAEESVLSAPSAPLGLPEPAVLAPAAPEKRAAAAVRRNGVAKRLPLGSPQLRETRTESRIAKGVTLTVIRRGEASRRGAKNEVGPWVVRVLTIDPQVARGRLTTTSAATVATTAPVTRLTRAANALAGVNASYFALGSRRPGNPVGLTVAGGKVLSDPSGMKREVTLLVDSQRNELRVAKLHWSGRLVGADGGTLKLTKVNALPRVPAACRSPRSQWRCQAAGQVAAFTARFGRHTPSGVGTEVLLGRDGCVERVQKHRGLRLRGGQTSIQATGAAGRKLRALAKEGCIEIRNSLRDAKGEKVELTPATSAVTGRFQLLDEGAIVAPYRRPDDFFSRHPRTIAGTTWDGKIVLATVDGRSKRSIGVTLREAAKIARALGMRDAANLDGGGSTTMAIRGKLANRVSGGRERAVSDALVWRREN